MNIKKDRKSYPNLSKDEQQALKSLAKDNSMVIKPAGKGRGIFIWVKKDCIGNWKAFVR